MNDRVGKNGIDSVYYMMTAEVAASGEESN